MVSGVALDNDAMKQLAARLKRLCATGGSVKGGTIIIQGDHRKIIQQSLQEIGFTVKMAGG